MLRCTETFESMLCNDPLTGQTGWLESTMAHFIFVILNKRPAPPEWAQDNFFVLRVA